MTKNITLRLDARILKEARHLAVEEDLSVSEWVARLVVETVSKRRDLSRIRMEALAELEQSLHLGGMPLRREEAHER